MVPRRMARDQPFIALFIADFRGLLDFLRGVYPSESPLARFGHTLLFRAGGANLDSGMDIKAT
jgi:hypothetical protein